MTCYWRIKNHRHHEEKLRQRSKKNATSMSKDIFLIVFSHLPKFYVAPSRGEPTPYSILKGDGRTKPSTWVIFCSFSTDCWTIYKFLSCNWFHHADRRSFTKLWARVLYSTMIFRLHQWTWQDSKCRCYKKSIYALKLKTSYISQVEVNGVVSPTHNITALHCPS